MDTTQRATPYEDALEELGRVIAGELVLPRDESYETHRKVWNGNADRRPAAVVRCANAGDVVAAVNLARALGAPIAVRSGGHSMAGFGTMDDGIVIDLSLMREITVDPEARTARIQPGLTWAEVAQALLPHGLALSSGDVGTVGVGGLTVGGGIGWMARKHGMTIDNLIAADVVLADGSVVRASAEDNPDLFWALRGGGGNFGIVTAFEFKVHPDAMIFGGFVMYPFAEARQVLEGVVQYCSTAPDELTTITAIFRAPPVPFIPPDWHGQVVVGILICYAGNPEEGASVVAPLQQLGTPVVNMVQPMPYMGMFQFSAEAEQHGLHGHVREGLFPLLGGDLLDTVLAHAGDVPADVAMTQIRVLGGAMGRVPADATAFAHRDQPMMLIIINASADAARAQAHRPWSEAFWQAVQPYSSGAYVNFVTDEEPGRVHDAYPPATYQRLAEIKRRYDPQNMFRRAHNIVPATV